MASYTSEQLRGAGTPIEAINGNVTFTLTNPSGSAYFTIETVRDSDGFYSSSSPKNSLGVYSSLSQVKSLVTSSYIASVVVPSGGGFFDFNPTTNIAAGTSMLRATGDISLEIS